MSTTPMIDQRGPAERRLHRSNMAPELARIEYYTSAHESSQYRRPWKTIIPSQVHFRGEVCNSTPQTQCSESGFRNHGIRKSVAMVESGAT
ncbi:cysteine synthase [Moniliophthora roreri]|nr:cysteine synthase [Moniliophthora roreri]